MKILLTLTCLAIGLAAGFGLGRATAPALGALRRRGPGRPEAARRRPTQDGAGQDAAG